MQHRKAKEEWETKVGEWTTEEPFLDKTTIEGVSIQLAGFQATHPQWGAVTGSAADVSLQPIDRAFFELVERITVLESIRDPKTSYRLLTMEGRPVPAISEVANDLVFPASSSPDYEFSKSNGVALHRTFGEACLRASYELIERDLILRSWAGLIKPTPLNLRPSGLKKSKLDLLQNLYEIKRVHFDPKPIATWKQPIYVSVVALFPKDEAHPLILAFGASNSLSHSLEKAEGEAIQRLGFLWGEEIPTTPPEFFPNNLYHQDFHLMVSERPNLEAWLRGDFYRSKGLEEKRQTDVPYTIHYLDLTRYPELRLKVAKAYCPEALPLVFGKWREREFRDLPLSRLIHPIA